MRDVVLLTGFPTIAVIAEMNLRCEGIREMAGWVKDRRPECLPDDYDPDTAEDDCKGPLAQYVETALFPHGGCRDVGGNYQLTSNELLVELAGRKCYDSFGLKAGRKSNAEYIEHTQSGEVPHRSIMYHAKMTFFFAGISRRVSHELIRNYVGADRNEEGAPSQESTRYTEHHGRYIVHPRDIDNANEIERLQKECQSNYSSYRGYISRATDEWRQAHNNEEPKQRDRKRILEAASSRLRHSVETSLIWTTNPAALTKLLIERDNEFADAEFQRFARYLKLICVREWPNLFPRFVKEWAAHDLNDDEGIRGAMAPWHVPKL